MLSKKKLLEKLKFYLILDAEVSDYRKLFEIVKIAQEEQADILQIRDKRGKAKDTLKFALQAVQHLKGRVPFIVNDRADVALASAADGVHLGQDDIPLKAVRKILGQKAIIGVSCQNFVDAQKAQSQGADYIGFGSVFKTLTKPEREEMDLKLLEKVAKAIHIPVFAIGGINLQNVGKILSLGIKRVAVCRTVCQAEDIARSIREFKAILR